MSVLPRLLAAALDPALRAAHAADTDPACARCCAEERLLRLARSWQLARMPPDDEPA